MPFDPNAPIKRVKQPKADVVVDTRQELKTPVEPMSESEAEMSEMGRVFGELPPEQKLRSRANEERDQVCNLVRWKLEGALRGTWREDLEMTYQAKLAQHRAYWVAFMKPDALYPADVIDTHMKALWVAESCNWSQQLLLCVVKALGI